MRKEVLEEIGLTKSEINVYLALLELGSSSTGKIIDKSKASSSKIYEILDRLMQKGLVSFIIKSGIKYFEAAPPERIMDYMKEKEDRLTKQKQELREVIPELELKQKLAKYKSEATVFKGMKGLETAFSDVFKELNKGDTIYAFVVGKIDERLNTFFSRQYRLRAKKGIRTKTIFSEPGRQVFESRKKIKLFEGKLIPTTSTSPATINVYKDKVIIRIGGSKEIIAVRIENKNCAQSFLEQFETLWNQDTTMTKGMQALETAITGFLDELKPGDTYNVLGAAFGREGYREQYITFFQGVHKKRIKKRIRARLLFEQGTAHIVKQQGELYKKYMDVKFLPYKTESPVATFSSGKRVILLIQKEEPIIINIKNKEVSQSFRRHFESRWNKLI